MALELRQQLKLTQQLIMTPQLQMAIKLLQLSRLELMDTIRQELEENPALEEISETAGDEPPGAAVETELVEPAAGAAAADGDKLREEFDWSGFLEDFSTPSRVSSETEEREGPRYEAFVAEKQSLNDHLLWQFLMTKPSREDERIASLIIGNLNKDGYLEAAVEEIAAANDLAPAEVERVLALLQTFDPPGVGARDLKECLLIQARFLGFESSLVSAIIRDHLPNLEKKNYKAICKALKADLAEVVAAVNVIKAMEPRPGRQFGDDAPQYIIPDIYV
jgi:RNA polymerase sigma-54 factor